MQQPSKPWAGARRPALRNLLVMRFVDAQEWDWTWALKQFAINRSELAGKPARHVGFGNGARPRGEEIPY